MKSKLIRGIGLATLALIPIIIIMLPSCSKKRVFSYDPAFNAYISAFTSKEISRTSPIRVRLVNDGVSADKVGSKDVKSPFTFSPAIEGTTVWTDTRTIEFHPKTPLPSDTYFEGELALGGLVQDLQTGLDVFKFQFATVRQTFEVIVDGTECTDEKTLAWQAINGTMNTADFEFNPLVEQTLSASQKGKKLNVKWTHAENGVTHTFRIDSVKREDKSSEVLIAWNGSPMGISLNGDQKVNIPALGEFYALNAHIYNDPDQYVDVEFSDPLKAGQNLDGLITIDQFPLKFTIEKNHVKVFPQNRIAGEHTIKVEMGIKNIRGYKLQKGNSWDVSFEELKPEVRLVSEGNILPRSSALPFPFEAVSLNAVDVTVTKIFENNVLQFLQVNDLGGGSELYRVGKEVVKTTIRLDGSKKTDLHQWSRHAIDLAPLISAEPGAIYRVKLSFKKEYSVFNCNGQGESAKKTESNNDDDDDDNDNEDGEDEDSYWDYYEDDYYNFWEHRDDPCHEAYYTYSYNDRSVGQNILASDFGILAKGGTEGSYTFVVTDLKTTNPMSGITLEVYDFTKQLIKKITTDSRGMATLSTEDKPFVVVAKSGTQRGYLKLDDGSSLSLSKFQVGGEKYYRGVKGFIYGERGVWRPGDSLFISFMLEDPNKSLPEDHPVTFTLFNPRGQEIKRIVKKEHLNGLYTFITSTAETAPTGNYRCDISVGGAVFTKTLKIETVLPNRLKVNIKFDKDQLVAGDKELNGNLSSTWLHGAIARNLKADVFVSMASTTTKFDRFKDYVFDDPINKFSSERQEVFDGTLDEEGKAKFPLKVDVSDDAPGLLNATFNTRVFEPGGNFSTDVFTMPYYPFEKMVGVKLPKGDRSRGMLLTDIEQTAEIAVVDTKGNPVGNDSVEVALYKVDWRWWWDQSYSDNSNYSGRFYKDELKKETIAVKNGIGKFKFMVKYPEWGRFLVRVTHPDGHSTGKFVYIDWPNWAGRPQKENPGGATMLTFSADKEKYSVGETVKLTIPAGKTGRALVSIESGSRVLKTDWVLANETGTITYTFVADKEMAPNIYAHVTFIQPHAQTANDLPIRMYGVIPLEVYDKTTQLKPVITSAAVFKPEENTSIKVSEAEGKEMTYTLAVVDEGLLDLTRFKTPDPWTAFYAKEALGVKTWDLFDQVIGAYNGDLSKLLSIGGDGEATTKEGAKVNRFRPVVEFMGPFVLKPGSSNTHTFRMPNYVGSVRVMVVARHNDAYGSAEKATPVRKPLMVLATLPRVLGPGEEIDLPVTLFAMENHIKNVSVKIETNDFFTINGSSTQSVVFSSVGDKVLNFSLKVKEKVGTANVKITATCGNEKAVYNVDVKVRHSNTKVNKTERGNAAGGATWSKDISYPGMPGTNSGTLEVSSIPPMNLSKRLNYLMQYPHGCIEQTTSSVFPQVYLTGLMELSEAKKMEVDRNVTAGIQRLTQFQQHNGGLSYWPGSGEVTEWGTNYGGAFIIEAKKRGYRIPTEFFNKWMQYQASSARTWNEQSVDEKHPHGSASSQLIQADRLYLLAYAGAPELGAMNRLKEKSNLSVVAKWRLAAAYKLAGQSETATQLSRGLTDDVPEYTELGYTYGSDTRDKAIILECMSVLGLQSRANVLVKQLSDFLSTDDWYNTQATGYSLVAMAKYAGVSGATSVPPLKFAWRMGTGAWTEVSSLKAMTMIDLKTGAATTGHVEVANRGNTQLSIRVSSDGIPAAGNETAFANELGITVTYTLSDGTPLDVSEIEQGTDFIAEVTVSNNGNWNYLEELALSQVFPSGWEIHNPRMMGPTGQESSIPEYQDIRDDRIYSYFDLVKYQPWHKKVYHQKTFRVMLNASYLGKFYLPMVKVEAMYDNAIAAGVPGKWVRVVKSSNGI